MREQGGDRVSALPARSRAALFGICAILIIGAVCAGVWFARSASPTHALPGPTASEVAARFVAAVNSGSDAWRAETLPTLLSRFEAGSAAPLRGRADALAAFEVTVTVQSGPLSFRSAGSPTDQEALADHASASLQLAYRAPTPQGMVEVTSSVELWLARPFFYGQDEPSEYRAGEQPSAVGPWRVLELMPQSAWTSTLQLQTACTSPQDVLAALSRSARVDGTLATLCTVGFESEVPVQGDAAAVAAEFPLVNEFTPLHDAMAPRDGQHDAAVLVQAALPVEDGTLIVVMVRTSFDTWAVLGIVAVSS